jgi:uncharacterized protein YdaU (DUF1376 family)
MIWVATQTPAEVDNFLAETAGMSASVFRAYSLIMYQLKRLGPILFDEVKLAKVARCGPKAWTNRIWPDLIDCFDVVDGFLSHPDITAGPSRRSLAAQKAAYARHQQERDRKAQLSLISDNTDAQQAAQPQRSSAIAEKGDAISRGNAAQSQDRRSPDASAEAVRPPPGAAPTHAGGQAAPARPRAPTPSLSESSFQEEGREFSGEGESERGSGGERLHAPPHAPRRANAASAQPPRTASAPAQPIAVDWQPDDRTRQEGVRLGVDVDDAAARFRDHCLSKEIALADFNARFRNWMRDDAKKLPPRQRGLPPMALGGGGAGEAATADDAEIAARVTAAESWLADRPELARQWKRVRERLRAEIGEADYRLWFRGTAFVAIDEGEVTLTAPTPLTRDRVNSDYRDRLAAWWQAVNPEVTRVEIEARATAQQAVA